MVGLLLRLPFLPVQGVIRIGEIIRDEANEQLIGAGAARRELEWARDEVAAGRMAPGEARALEDEVASRVTRPALMKSPPSDPARSQPALRRKKGDRDAPANLQEGADLWLSETARPKTTRLAGTEGRGRTAAWMTSS